MPCLAHLLFLWGKPQISVYLRLLILAEICGWVGVQQGLRAMLSKSSCLLQHKALYSCFQIPHLGHCALPWTQNRHDCALSRHRLCPVTLQSASCPDYPISSANISNIYWARVVCILSCPPRRCDDCTCFAVGCFYLSGCFERHLRRHRVNVCVWPGVIPHVVNNCSCLCFFPCLYNGYKPRNSSGEGFFVVWLPWAGIGEHCKASGFLFALFLGLQQLFFFLAGKSGSLGYFLDSRFI